MKRVRHACAAMTATRSKTDSGCRQGGFESVVGTKDRIMDNRIIQHSAPSPSQRQENAHTSTSFTAGIRSLRIAPSISLRAMIWERVYEEKNGVSGESASNKTEKKR
jgi:hypothetical protein